MHRGNNRRRLFSYPKDYLKLLRYLVDALEKADSAIRVHAFAVMSNHLHLIVTPDNKLALANFVKSFAQRYTGHRNRERGGSGKLFEARFVSKPILDDTYLAVCHGYVELNPVRAGIVDAAGEYRWSSYRYWARSSAASPLMRELLTPSPWHLSLGSTGRDRAAGFERWVEACRIFGRKPEDVAEWDKVEAYSASYTRRLERPDGSSAREATADYLFRSRGQRPSNNRRLAE